MRSINVSFAVSNKEDVVFTKEGTTNAGSKIKGEKLDSNALETLLRQLDEIEYMEMETEEYTSLNLEFGENGECFIGYIEDEDTIYYFDNGNGKTETASLYINPEIQKRLLCWSADDIRKIVRHFWETGKRDMSYKWISDEDVTASENYDND